MQVSIQGRKVFPITKKQDLENILFYLDNIIDKAETEVKIKIAKRNKFLFLFGINVGLRISDILDLKVRDVKKGFVYIRDKKTAKENVFELNNDVLKIVDNYIKELNLKDDEYLFKNFYKMNQPISRQALHNFFKKIECDMNLKYSINTHTLRKTYGYHFYKQTKDIYTLSKILNHSDVRVTERYIGLADEEKNKARKSFSIGF